MAGPPASSTVTRTARFSLSRAASTQPADPPPMISTSALSSIAPLYRTGRRELRIRANKLLLVATRTNRRSETTNLVVTTPHIVPLLNQWENLVRCAASQGIGEQDNHRNEGDESMHRIVMHRGSWIATAIVLFPAVGAVAADSPEQLAPIVVVGQKENESLQKAPEAITAISSQQLRDNFIRAPEDLNSQVPSLVIGQTEGYNNVVAIRGIGLNSPQDDGSPASVSFHQNGIFVPDPISLDTNFLDVDHIEVLRGPQGTVFGQNSVGGTVNVITVQPKLNDFSGYTRLEFGSYDLQHATAAVTLPVASTLAVRLAGDFIQQQGYATATQVPGTDFQ